MNINIKEKTLFDVLKETGLSELPKRYSEDCGLFWIKAIVLVEKTVSQSYVIAEHRADGLIRYVKDPGLMEPIEKLISIHPYMYLDKRRMKEDGFDKRTLISYFGDSKKDEILAMDDGQRVVLSRQMAIELQLAEKDPYYADRSELDALKEQEAVIPLKEQENTASRDGSIEVLNDSIMEDVEILNVEPLEENINTYEKKKRGRRTSKK